MNLIAAPEDERVAEVAATAVAISDLRDAVDMVGNAALQGFEAVVLRQEQLPAAFFDLSTGLAGDVLQKFANYRLRVAIVGGFAEGGSESLRAFVREANRGDQVAFVADRETAIERLTGALGRRQVG